MAPGGDKVSTQCQRGRICHSIAHSGKGAVAVAGLVVVVLLALRGGYAAASRSLSSVTRALWGGDGAGAIGPGQRVPGAVPVGRPPPRMRLALGAAVGVGARGRAASLLAVPVCRR